MVRRMLVHQSGATSAPIERRGNVKAKDENGLNYNWVLYQNSLFWTDYKGIRYPDRQITQEVEGLTDETSPAIRKRHRKMGWRTYKAVRSRGEIIRYVEEK